MVLLARYPNPIYFVSLAMLSLIASSVAFLTLSSSSLVPFLPASSVVLVPADATTSSSFSEMGLASFSSSLSPRLNGSLSPTGLGSTVESGCHLLDFPPEPGAAAVVMDDGFGFVDEYISWISSGGPSWNDTLRLFPGEGRRSESLAPERKRLGFASGRLDVRGGASPSRNSSLEKSSSMS